MTQSKYRPVLTSQQISHILTLCKRDMSEESISVISTLSVFEHKIRNTAISPAYTEKPKISLAESLGLEIDPLKAESTKAASRELRKAALYHVWNTDESLRKEMTVNDLILVKEYRYENNLMETQEELEYEQGLFNTQSTISRI